MIVPAGKVVDSLAKQIRLTGMAYPLFDIAALVVAKPERFGVRYSVAKRADGSPACPLFLCDLDQTLFPSLDEAVRHVLRKHFDTFYQAEQTPIDPPKGNYTFVAQCGLSGKVLGPPNFHDYQNQLRKLHAERYSKMPFEQYKSRVKIVRDEEVVKKWLEDQSFKTEYICLNVPDELKLPTREAVEEHFREVHLEVIIKQVNSHVITSSALTEQPSRPIKELYRRTFSQQQKFPIKVVHELSQQFSSKGLQFFKVNKSVTHVAVARPRFLDFETTPVADAIRGILEYINATPGCNRRTLLEALAPAEAEAPAVPAATEAADTEATEAAETPALPDARVARLSPAAQAIHDDLHWLIHEGHVIEFASGILETAKAPKNPQARDAAEAYERKMKRKPGQARKKADSRETPTAATSEPEATKGEPSPTGTPSTEEKASGNAQENSHPDETTDVNAASEGAGSTEKAPEQASESIPEEVAIAADASESVADEPAKAADQEAEAAQRVADESSAVEDEAPAEVAPKAESEAEAKTDAAKPGES